MLAKLHPSNILKALDEIDEQTPSYTLTRPQALRRVFGVLAVVSIALLFMHYAKFMDNFQLVLESIARAQHLPDEYYVNALVQKGIWVIFGGPVFWPWVMWHYRRFIFV
jgi:uncharacterized protein